MKTRISSFLLAAMAFALVACSNDEPESQATVIDADIANLREVDAN